MSTFNELIDFTRSTTGTYLDSVVYGDELVTNGTFDNNIDGWSQTAGTVSYVSGRLSVIGNGTVGRANITLGIPVTAGKTYSVTVGVEGAVNRHFVHFGTVAGSSDILGNFTKAEGTGTYTAFIVATTSSLFIQLGSVGSDTSLYDNVSVKEVIGGQVSGTPLLRTAAINEPRLEYDASGNPLGLLIEEARTNVLTRSNEFLTAPWNGDAGRVASSIPSIDGGQCFKLSSNGGLSDYWIQSTVASNGQTKSIWARTVSGTGTVHILGHNSVPTTLVTLTEEWQRFSLNVGVGEAGGTNFYAVDFRGSGTLSEILVFGAQVETGAFPTSYIPTSGSTVTRTKDVASLPVERFAYNQPQGSIVCHFNYFFESGNSKRTYEFSDGTDNNVMRIMDHANVNQLQANVKSGGAGVAGILINAPTMLSGVKTFQSYKLNGYSGGADGTLAGTDSSGALPIGIHKLNIGSRRDGTVTMSGHITSLQYYPKKLTDAQLELLTQPSASPTMNLTFDGQATSTLVEGLHD